MASSTSNRPIRARKAADAVRKHWGIENKQHYTRDVTLREDASRIRRNPGIFARLRSFAYNILRFNQSDTIAQDRYAAALGGLEALSDMNYYKERLKRAHPPAWFSGKLVALATRGTGSVHRLGAGLR